MDKLGKRQDGKRNGKGTHTFPDGSSYVSEWKDGKFNGQGTLTTQDRTIYAGLWKNGLLSASEHW